MGVIVQTCRSFVGGLLDCSSSNDAFLSRLSLDGAHGRGPVSCPCHFIFSSLDCIPPSPSWIWIPAGQLAPLRPAVSARTWKIKHTSRTIFDLYAENKNTMKREPNKGWLMDREKRNAWLIGSCTLAVSNTCGDEWYVEQRERLI